jgi:hypothetical protein
MTDILIRIFKSKIHHGERMTELNGNANQPLTEEPIEVKPQPVKGALLHELAEHRHDPEFIAQSFRSGIIRIREKFLTRFMKPIKNKCRLSY